MPALIFIFGTIIGSFLNVVIFRLHRKCSILGRSLCFFCQKFIRWYDNIPLFSFLNLRGKCRFCRRKISWQYPLVEVTTGILFLLFYWKYVALGLGQNLFYLFRDLVFVSILMIIFVYDLRWYLILDIITIPAAIFAFLINLYLGLSWWSLLLGALIGGGFFLAQFLISSGRWIGGGDIRLGVLLGAMLGWQLLLLALFLAYAVGSIIGLSLIIAGQKKFSSRVPFGTFLSSATMATLLWGSLLLRWYLGMLK